MTPAELEALAQVAERAADRARAEILPRFRAVGVEHKADGSPVTEADRRAEQVIRETLLEARPDFGVLGEEHGETGPVDGARWVVDPIDGTLGFSRGIPLFTTLIALVVEGQSVLGLIDCPGTDERYVGWRGGGCRRNGHPTRCSQDSDLQRAIVSHGDPFCFERAGRSEVFLRMAREIPMLRGYTDAFGHAQVLGGGIGAMVDLDLNPWDVAATQVLVPEAGGRCVTLPGRGGKVGLVLGAPALVDTLASWFD